MHENNTLGINYMLAFFLLITYTVLKILNLILGYNTRRVLIRPDPSFNFNPSLSDSDEDTVDQAQNTNVGKQQTQICERLRGSESIACLPSTLQSHSTNGWRGAADAKDDPILSSPNNLRRHTLGQQHFLRHQQQALHSQKVTVQRQR